MHSNQVEAVLTAGDVYTATIQSFFSFNVFFFLDTSIQHIQQLYRQHVTTYSDDDVKKVYWLKSTWQHPTFILYTSPEESRQLRY